MSEKLENNLLKTRSGECSDALASEALAGMPSLVAELKAEARRLALGSSSSFVDQKFGEPMIVDEKTGQLITGSDSALSSPDRDLVASPAVDGTGTGFGAQAKDRSNDSESKAAVIPMSEKGEIIIRDVEPAIAHYTKGESLSQIAREHLGVGASEDDVKKHVAEIARINGIKNPDRPLDGRLLALPGHTADGGFVTTDADGNKRTIWHNGRVRVQNNDNSGCELTPDGHGNDLIHHWGSDPKDHTYFLKKADGSYLIADGKDDLQGHKPRDTQEELLVERAHLIN